MILAIVWRIRKYSFISGEFAGFKRNMMLEFEAIRKSTLIWQQQQKWSEMNVLLLNFSELLTRHN